MWKFLCVISAISFIGFLLGILGLVSPITSYEPIAKLADEAWMQPIIRYSMSLTIGGSFGAFLFSVLGASLYKNSKKR
ncbi:MAG: hypothetical protein ABSF74_09795 [Dehalococcoidia bacterium]